MATIISYATKHYNTTNQSFAVAEGLLLFLLYNYLIYHKLLFLLLSDLSQEKGCTKNGTEPAQECFPTNTIQIVIYIHSTKQNK